MAACYLRSVRANQLASTVCSCTDVRPRTDTRPLEDLEVFLDHLVEEGKVIRGEDGVLKLPQYFG